MKNPFKDQIIIDGLQYCNWNRNLFEDALSYYFKSLKIRNSLNDEKGAAISYKNIGRLLKAVNRIELILIERIQFLLYLTPFLIFMKIRTLLKNIFLQELK